MVPSVPDELNRAVARLLKRGTVPTKPHPKKLFLHFPATRRGNVRFYHLTEPVTHIDWGFAVGIDDSNENQRQTAIVFHDGIKALLLAADGKKKCEVVNYKTVNLTDQTILDWKCAENK